MTVEIDIKKKISETFFLRSCVKSGSNRIVFLGPSGAGKTLTLKAAAGLLKPDCGIIRIKGRTLFDSDRKINLPVRSRRAGFLFQNYALFPHLSVRENIAFGLNRRNLRSLNRGDCKVVDQVMERLELKEQAENRPSCLSGGQQQRVALARILVVRPGFFLLDEPFSALDIPLRARMRKELDSLLAEYDIPVLMVSHDPEDAEIFGEEVIEFPLPSDFLASGHLADQPAQQEDTGTCQKPFNHCQIH
ncbi:MAG: sulfate/molybdate ABC transporter ATP-binding protein [Desulfurivibrionaceae bacterium]